MYIYIYICIYLYICIYVYMYVYMYISIYVYISRLSYLFAHLDLLYSETFSFLIFFLLFSSLLFSDSSYLCFSSVHIVRSLTSKLLSISYLTYLSIYLSIYLPIYLSINQSIYLSIYLPNLSF